MTDFLAQYGSIFAALGLFSLFTLLLSLLALPWLLAAIPYDYFSDPEQPTYKHTQRHPLLATLVLVIRNSLGVLLLLAGIAMLVLPGQGLLTIFASLIISDFPGKYRLEYYFVTRPGALNTINWFRQKAKAEPLRIPEDDNRH